MEKKINLVNLVNRYCKISATKSYIFGFVRNGSVYAVKVEDADRMLSELVFLGSASRGQGFSIRFRPNKVQQELILANASEVKILCSYEYLEEVKKEYGNNRGNAFENLSAIAFSGKLNESKNAKFTECGDMNINGKEYQAKFGCKDGAATFTNEATLHNLEEERELKKLSLG